MAFRSLVENKVQQNIFENIEALVKSDVRQKNSHLCVCVFIFSIIMINAIREI